MEKVEQLRSLSKDETSLINTCAILDAFMYLDTQEESYTGRTLKDLVYDSDFTSQANKKYISAIQDAISKNSSIGDITIISQSGVDNLNIPYVAPYSGFGPELIVANAFALDTGDICVAYRGTGAGKWVDNGQAFGQESTVMQEAAVRYFDYVFEQYGTNNDKNFYVTGHSKGGNEAQYVCMAAEHNYEISHCYEFDGQGFSPEAIEKFEEINGKIQFYDMQIDKITAICGKNDFVSPLGVSIVKPENKYYVQTVNSALNMAGHHDIFYMFNQENPDCINFNYDKSGEAISIEQGNLGKCAANLSDNFMKMNINERGDCGIAMMSIIEKISNGGHGTGDIKGASFNHTLTFMAKGIPMLSNAFIDKSTFDSVYGLCHNLIKEGTEDKKFGKIIGAVAIGALYTASYAIGLPLSKVIGGISSLSAAAIHGIKEIGVKIRERGDMVRSLVADVKNNIMQDYYERIGESYEYDTKPESFRDDRKVRMSSLEAGIPELAVVIAATSVEQFLYQENQIAKHGIHTMINYVDIASELGRKYGVGHAHQDIQEKALYVAEHKAIECIKRGENVMLFMPDMYDPTFRAQVNETLSKALKNTRYTSTAIVLDNTNGHIFKHINSNFATYMEQNISDVAKELIEKYPPSTEDKNCKYDYVISDGWNKEHSISELDYGLTKTLEEYMGGLNDAYRESIGSYDSNDYNNEDFLYDKFEEELQEDLTDTVSQFCDEDIDDIER